MARPILKRLYQELARALHPIRGLWVEDKGYTLSVHYRSVPDSDWVLVKNGFYEAVRPYVEKRQVRVTEGKRVFEVRPPVRWDKGKVLQWLLTRQRAVGRGKVLPIYAGDDQTDEDAFLALQGQGIAIAVGPSTLLSRAQYVVSSPQEVCRFLSRVLGIWKAKQLSCP
jgi:trehalose-phosphatase